MTHGPASSLFLFHFPSNTGYALAVLERTFYEVGLELAGGDSGRVYFGYPDISTGPPRSLPAGFTNLVSFDYSGPSARDLRYLADYVRAHEIDLVVIFDIQPVHPLFEALRKGGVKTIIAYWGAPICPLMPRWRLALKKLGIALSRSKVDSLVFESQAMADFALRGRGVPPRMLDIVPLGVDTEVFKPLPSAHVCEQFDFPRERKVVVYAGHMERRKGVHVLVEAAIELLLRRRRADVCFLICGNQGEESKEYERMYAGQGIDPLIRFGGYRPDLARIYPSCFCGVIPSSGWDSFAFGSIEMAASGLPVIASRLQGLTDAVVENETGLHFTPGNAQELADCIEKLLDDPALAAQYGSNGRKRCEEELSIVKQRERLLHVFQKRLSAAR
jgi:glycosyltransferase involved in cell wall biosynthesis